MCLLFLRLIFAISLILPLSSCSVGFVSKAAYNYLDILWRSEEIERLVADRAVEPSLADKLVLILEARKFAEEIGLDVRENYTKYVAVDSSSLAWVVTASKRNSFLSYTWWYPFVGSVPYKGYFEYKSAKDLALALEEEGYETSVRDTVALSTLGWFSDPVLSSITQLSEEQMIETILHELLHATIWVPGVVDFNETLANFVGLTAAHEFFLKKVESSEETGKPQFRSWADNVKRQKAGAVLFAQYLEALMDALTALYQKELPLEELLPLRERTLQSVNATFEPLLTAQQMYRTVNNAALLGTSLYYKQFSAFQMLFDKSGQNWARFLSCIERIASDHSDDPYAALTNENTCHDIFR